MQLSGDATLAAAVESDSRVIVYRFEVDWNRNGLYNHALSDLTKVVKRMRVERSMTGTLPAETTMVEGYQTAQLNVTLGGTRPGDSQTIALQLSPYNASAPLFGDGRLVIPVRAHIGHQVENGASVQVRQFTGTISNFSINSRSQTVSLTCFDPSDTLRAPIDLPLWALEKTLINNPIADWRTNSQWVVDYVLRQNGIYMSPPPQAGCIYSATLHGGMAPEIGHMPFLDVPVNRGVCTPEDQVYWPGRPGWGLAYGGTPTRIPVSYARAKSGFQPRSGYSISFQAQIDFTKVGTVYPGATGTWCIYSSGPFSFGSAAGTNIRMRITRTGQLCVDFLNSNSLFAAYGGPTLALDGYKDVWCRIDFGTPLSASSISWPGLTMAVDLSPLDLAQPIWKYPCITLGPSFPMHDVQVCNATGLAAGATLYDPTTWVPQCDLDTGLNDVSGLPLRRGVDSWGLLREVVGAEYGVIGFTEEGRAFFKNRDTVRRQNLTVEKTLTRRKHLTDLQISERTGSVRNIITAKIAPRVIGPSGPSARVGWDTVFKLTDKDAIQFPPGTSLWTVKLDTPAWVGESETEIQQSASAAGAWPPPVDNTTRYACVRAIDNTIEIPGVSVGITTLGPEFGLDSVRLTIFNPTNFPGVFARIDGDPALWISGRKYSQDIATELSYRRASSAARYNSRTLDLPDSDWHQREGSLARISRNLLRDLRAPVPVIDPITIVGDCRLQLQDTCLLDDSQGLGAQVYATVVDLVRTLEVGSSAAKLTDQVIVRPFGAPGRWILGHPVWGILGQTTKL